MTLNKLFFIRVAENSIFKGGCMVNHIFRICQNIYDIRCFENLTQLLYLLLQEHNHLRTLLLEQA